MKVLFLDIDGVLNSEDWFVTGDKSTDVDYLGLRSIDPVALSRLQYVLSETGAKVVLSSTWRLVPDYVDQLIAAGLEIYDKTPVLQHTSHRGEEIIEWLVTNTPDDSTLTFAIVDDDADAGDSPVLKPRFIQTHWKHGLLDAHAQRLILLLGKER